MGLPYSTAPQLVERKPGLVDMMVRDQAEVDILRFWGAPTLNDAYGDPSGTTTGDSLVLGAGPELMFQVFRSGQYRSPSVVSRKWRWYGESLRGMSRVAYDPDDLVSPTNSLPSDEQYGFVRVQESRPATVGGYATGFVDLNSAVATDTALIKGVTFTAQNGAGNPAAQTFDVSSGVPTAVSEFIAAVNHATTQALLLAASPTGITVTASDGGGGFVLITCTTGGLPGNQVTLSATGAIVVSGASLTGGESFLTVRGIENHGDPKLGPIYVVPTPAFFGTPEPTLSIRGTAPANTGCTAGSIPAVHPDMQDPNPMHIILPRTTSSISIVNLANPAGSDTLLLSTGLGATMTATGPTDDPATVFGAFKEIVVAGAGSAAVPFSIHAVVSLGVSK